MYSGFLVVAMAVTAAGHAPLRLQLDACVDVDKATVNRVVATELQADLGEENPPEAMTTARAECLDGRVRLTIDDPVTGKVTTRMVDLDDRSRPIRSRVLGLAISEAVLASWIELQLTPQPLALQPGLPTSSDLQRQATRIAERHLHGPGRARPPSSWDLALGPALRWFSSSGVLSAGVAGEARRWSMADGAHIRSPRWAAARSRACPWRLACSPAVAWAPST